MLHLVVCKGVSSQSSLRLLFSISAAVFRKERVGYVWRCEESWILCVIRQPTWINLLHSGSLHSHSHILMISCVVTSVKGSWTLSEYVSMSECVCVSTVDSCLNGRQFWERPTYLCHRVVSRTDPRICIYIHSHSHAHTQWHQRHQKTVVRAIDGWDNLGWAAESTPGTV